MQPPFTGPGPVTGVTILGEKGLAFLSRLQNRLVRMKLQEKIGHWHAGDIFDAHMILSPIEEAGLGFGILLFEGWPAIEHSGSNGSKYTRIEKIEFRMRLNVH